MKHKMLSIIILGLFLIQSCYASNANTSEISPLMQALKKTISFTPYSALIIYTSVDIVSVPDSSSDDDYAQEKQIYHAKVLETYRGQKQKNISYTMIVEKGEVAIIDRGPVVVTLCKHNKLFYWPGTGSEFPATEEVTRTARLTGQNTSPAQQFYPYCE